MQGQTPNEAASGAGSGRHRKPAAGARRRLPVILAGVVALVVVVAVAVAVQLGRGSTPTPQAAPSDAPASSSPTSSAPSSGSTSTEPSADPSTSSSAPSASPSTATSSSTATPSASPTDPVVTGSSPAALATALTGRFDELQADALTGALVATAPLGDDVVTGATAQTGAWEQTKLPNGMSVARNNTLALRQGKVEATSGVTGHAGPADVRAPGGVVRLRREAATDTVARMKELDGPTCSGCRPVTLTSAQATTIVMPTTQGDVVVPAWSFGVQGSKVRVIRPALSSDSVLQVSPPFRGAPAAAVVKSQLPLWSVAVAKDGRTVTANLDRPTVTKSRACWRLLADETSHSVALYATPAKPDAAGTCADPRGRAALRLSAPLGERTLLDTYWQRALPAR